MIIVRPESLYLTLDLEFYCVDEVKNLCSWSTASDDVKRVRCHDILAQTTNFWSNLSDGKAVEARLC